MTQIEIRISMWINNPRQAQVPDLLGLQFRLQDKQSIAVQRARHLRLTCMAYDQQKSKAPQ